MFICSVRASTLRFAAVLAVSAVVIGTLVFSGAGKNVSESAEVMLKEGVSYTGIKTEADRQTFLKSFGITVGKEPTVAEVTLPKEPDTVILGYNEIQRAQGLDLIPYAGKTVTRYTYEVDLPASETGEPQKAYANLILYRNRVIAADVTATGQNGFVRGLDDPE
ncbi:MAG: DUF4830 domain-containing protein [Clostridia bacterium]|nr:DUF4830 domain-containing protein [Clostridia bacterium]